MNNCLTESNLTPEQMLADLPRFFEKLLKLASDIGIDVTDYQADHVALRINENDLAQEAHQAWLRYGEELSAATINGRPIIVIEFEQPISIKHWNIECIEIPYPAKGKLYPQQGWEHIEFVIPSDAQTVETFLVDIKKIFPKQSQKWEELDELGIKVKLSSPQGESERLSNPTVAFKRDGVCIKLHPHSLKNVVLSES